MPSRFWIAGKWLSILGEATQLGNKIPQEAPSVEWDWTVGTLHGAKVSMARKFGSNLANSLIMSPPYGARVVAARRRFRSAKIPSIRWFSFFHRSKRSRICLRVAATST
jgi:hypothetical protein